VISRFQAFAFSNATCNRYVPAEREDHVKKALQGMRHVYHAKPARLVPIKVRGCTSQIQM
jgi:hypothetical protein